MTSEVPDGPVCFARPVAMSQRSVPLPAGHPVKALQGLSKAIALPHEYPPTRLPSFPALERTAVMGFSVPVSLSIAASSTVRVGTIRQAAYPSWADLAPSNRVCAQLTYRMAPVDGAAVSTTNMTGVPLTLYSHYVTTQVASNDVVGTSGITGTDWLYPPVGVDSATGPLPWIYVPPGATVSIVVFGTNVWSAANAVTATLTFDRWVGPGEAPSAFVTTIVIAGNTTGKDFSFTNANSFTQWLRLRNVEFSSLGVTNNVIPFVTVLYSNAATHSYLASNSNAGTVTLTGQITAKLFMPLVYPTEFSNSVLPWQSTRTTATAALFTNVTQVLNKGGTVLAGRGSPSLVTGSLWGATQGFVSNLHPAEKAYLGLETGHYTYVPPSTDLATFWDYTVSPQQTAQLPCVRLDNDSLFNIAFFTASAVDEQLAVNVDWHIEFRTTSTLFQIGLCTLTLETLHQAQVSLAAIGYFFENFNHKAILQFITDSVRRYGPTALSMIPHPAARAASMVLSSSPGKTPPTTTAKAAGFNGPARQRSRGPSRSKKVKVAMRKKR